MPKIGVIVGREWSWPPAFIEEVNKRGGTRARSRGTTKEVPLQLEVSMEEAQTVETLLERAFRDLLEETAAAEDEEMRRHLGRRAVLIKGLLSRIQTATV